MIMATKKAKATKSSAKKKIKSTNAPRKSLVDILPQACGKNCPCLSALGRIEAVLGQDNRWKLKDDLDLVRAAVGDCPDSCGCCRTGRLSVVFSESGDFLGELTTMAGRFSDLKLSVAGEDVLGEKVHDWQLMGVPPASQQNRPVMLRDDDFLDAFIGWCEAEGFRTVTLLEPQISLWTAVQCLKLSDEERPEAIERLSRLPLDVAFGILERWSAESGF